MKTLPINFSNTYTNTNNFAINNNNNNFESRVKYLSDLDFKNPKMEEIHNRTFKVNDEIGKKCLELTNEFRRKNKMSNLMYFYDYKK